MYFSRTCLFVAVLSILCVNQDFSMSRQLSGSGWLDYAKSGNLKELQLLANQVDIDMADAFGNTALHNAISSDSTDSEAVVEFLLSLGSDIHKRNSKGKTALHAAVTNLNGKMVSLLLAMPDIEVNAKDDQGRTPLHWASFMGVHEIVQQLLKFPGIKVNILDKDGNSAFRLAVSKNRDKVLPLFASVLDINELNIKGDAALHEAVKGNQVKAVSCLLNTPGIQINLKNGVGQTALELAKESGNEAMINLLSEKALKHDLFTAIKENAVKKMREMIAWSNMSWKDEEGDTPLHKAFIYNRGEIALMILKTQNAEDLLSITNKKDQVPFDLLDQSSDLYKACQEQIEHPELDVKLKQEKSAESKERTCDVCHKENSTKRCGGCKNRTYCSVDCQRLDWPTHKHNCRKV